MIKSFLSVIKKQYRWLMTIFALLALGIVYYHYCHPYVVSAYNQTSFYINTIYTKHFQLKRVDYKGIQHGSKRSLEKLLRPYFGQSIRLDTIREIKAKIMDFEWFNHVSIYHYRPDRLVIHVIEHEPAFIWHHKNIFYVTDKDGRVITKKPRTRFNNLPLFTGDGAAQQAQTIQNAVQGYALIDEKVHSYELVRKRRWNLNMHGDLLIKLPEKNIDAALRDLERILSNYDIKDLSNKIINLTQPDRIIMESLDLKDETKNTY